VLDERSGSAAVRWTSYERCTSRTAVACDAVQEKSAATGAFCEIPGICRLIALKRDRFSWSQSTPRRENRPFIAEFAYQAAIEHGMKPGIGTDLETAYSGDMFPEMRVAFSLQRAAAQARRYGGDLQAPAPVGESLAHLFAAGYEPDRLATRFPELPGE
jgi:hypothetical protein